MGTKSRTYMNKVNQSKNGECNLMKNNAANICLENSLISLTLTAKFSSKDLFLCSLKVRAIWLFIFWRRFIYSWKYGSYGSTARASLGSWEYWCLWRRSESGPNLYINSFLYVRKIFVIYLRIPINFCRDWIEHGLAFFWTQLMKSTICEFLNFRRKKFQWTNVISGDYIRRKCRCSFGHRTSIRSR